MAFLFCKLYGLNICHIVTRGLWCHICHICHKRCQTRFQIEFQIKCHTWCLKTCHQRVTIVRKDVTKSVTKKESPKKVSQIQHYACVTKDVTGTTLCVTKGVI